MKTYNLDGSANSFFSGWYVPKQDSLVMFRYAGHDKFMKEYFSQPFSEVKGDASELIEYMRNTIGKKEKWSVTSNDFYKNGWVRVNNNHGVMSMTSFSIGKKAVLSVWDSIKQWAKSLNLEVGVKFLSDVKPSELETESDMDELLYEGRMMHARLSDLAKRMSGKSDKVPNYLKVRKEWSIDPATKIKQNKKIYDRNKDWKKEWEREASMDKNISVECKMSGGSVWLYAVSSAIGTSYVSDAEDVANKMVMVLEEIVADIKSMVKIKREKKIDRGNVTMKGKKAGEIEIRLPLIFDIDAGFEDKAMLGEMLKLKHRIDVEFM